MSWPGAVEFLGEQLLGQRHADRVGDALAERAGRGLDARRDADLGVARRLAVQLAEVAQLAHRQVVAGQVQQRVQQHRAVAVAQHEAVAVGPLRVGRVVAQVAAPQRDGHVGHAHRRAGVAGVGLLHGVHRQRADRVGHQGRVGGRSCVWSRWPCGSGAGGRKAGHFRGDRSGAGCVGPGRRGRIIRAMHGLHLTADLRDCPVDRARDDRARRAARAVPRRGAGGRPAAGRRAVPPLRPRAAPADAPVASPAWCCWPSRTWPCTPGPSSRA